MPSVSVHIPARSCGNSFKTPVFGGTIDDVLIDVLLQPIDGLGESRAPPVPAVSGWVPTI